MLPNGILDLHAISSDDPASSKKRVLEQAARLLAGNAAEPSQEHIFECLLERERLGSTGLAGGVALPHARIHGIDDTRGAFVRLRAPVEFDAMDGQPVDLVFALLVPEDATEAHLQLLAQLAGMFNDPDLRQKLRQADAQQALEIFNTSRSPDAT